jgi:hypothetical protein
MVGAVMSRFVSSGKRRSGLSRRNAVMRSRADPQTFTPIGSNTDPARQS